MSEILSYSNNTSKSGEEDWIGHAPYSDDDIARIKDPDGGLSENPRTAIPSPLAQLDLVKNAFKQLANERLRGEPRGVPGTTQGQSATPALR